ncbi:MAG: GNAT family N-acetyltransferase [Candidatus Thorarchaeota archaeon]
MSSSIRELTIKDHEHVNNLCKTVWNGNDYVPQIFQSWIENPLSQTLGLFENGDLVAFGNLEKVEGTDTAWVQGLRVKDGHREKGHATTITNALVTLANGLDISTLWYATSSRNQSSMKVAEKCGFHKADSTGYFRIYAPYPPHPRPSLSIVPLKIDAERLYELLTINPDLVESNTFPLAWHFDFKTEKGLTRLLQNAEIKAVVDESGVVSAVYCLVLRERNDEATAAFTVFSTDRGVFVDIMSRMIDQAEALGADRAVFFLGPRVKEWALNLGYVSDEFVGRKFLLYEKNPREK